MENFNFQFKAATRGMQYMDIGRIKFGFTYAKQSYKCSESLISASEVALIALMSYRSHRLPPACIAPYSQCQCR